VDKIAEFWGRVERSLFPHLEECLPEMTKVHRQVVLTLEVVRIEEHVAPGYLQWLGRRRKDRKALARAFVAKACCNIPTTKALVDRLLVDRVLRQLCGWERADAVPSLATFSRAFGEFAKSALADETHAALVKTYLKDEIVWHVSRDSTAIGAREKPAPAPARVRSTCGRGRPRKDERRPKAPSRIQTQYLQSADEAIAELPKVCDVGVKSDFKGGKRHWTGYKLHVDVGDGGIPLCAVTTSASVHDSQVALPLMRMTSQRVTSLYDLMDSAYDADLIRKVSCELGHVPIIDSHPGNGREKIRFESDRLRRYYNRTGSERFNARLKDDCGGRSVRVKGHMKVHSHLMYGVLVIFAQALLGLVT
jgi:hypothetical protein